MRRLVAIAALTLFLPAAALAQSATQDTQGGKGARETSTSAKGEKILDDKFAQQAARDSLAEIEMGQMARDKKPRQAVAQFARRMIDDHTKANRQLGEILVKQQITMPAEPDRAHRQAAERLAKLSGEEFERAYMRQMVQDHQKSVTLFERQARDGQDAQLRRFAENSLPALREHLEMAQDIYGREAAAEPSGKGKSERQRVD